MASCLAANYTMLRENSILVVRGSNCNSFHTIYFVAQHSCAYVVSASLVVLIVILSKL